MDGGISKRKDGKYTLYFKGVKKTFGKTKLKKAERYLNYLRFSHDQGRFDARDHMGGQPNGFTNLAEQWLDHKKQVVKPRTYAAISFWIHHVARSWGNRNVKFIEYADLEDIIFGYQGSNKSRSNFKSVLHDFWSWLRRRRIIKPADMPEFPVVNFELGWRKIITKADQAAVIDKIYDLTWRIEPKIYVAVKLGATYISLRPGEIMSLTEGNIMLNEGILIFPSPKEKTPKIVPLLDEDIELLGLFPKGMPELKFFRHSRSRKGGVVAGRPFGNNLVRRWWQKACQELGIDGVGLYGGTRHTSATALGQIMTPEQIKAGTMHSTNKAFERYFKRDLADAKKVYAATRRGVTRGCRSFEPLKNKNLKKIK